MPPRCLHLVHHEQRDIVTVSELLVRLPSNKIRKQPLVKLVTRGGRAAVDVRSPENRSVIRDMRCFPQISAGCNLYADSQSELHVYSKTTP